MRIRLATTVLALLYCGGIGAHPDAAGTRFVASSGEDEGDCDSNHHPCRTLQYALTRVRPGDAIKLAAGTYELTNVDLEALAIGKEGVRGGYSAEDHFAIQNAESNPTRVSGVPDDYRNNFIAHGFIVVDAEGNALPRIVAAKLHSSSNCSGRVTNCMAALSTIISSYLICGYFAATSRQQRRNKPSASFMMLAL